MSSDFPHRRPADALCSDRPQHDTRAYYAASAAAFLASDDREILGQLAIRVASERRGNEIQQMHAWRREVALLRSTLSELRTFSSHWGLLLELPLLRLGRRIDAILLIRSVIVVLVQNRSTRLQFCRSRASRRLCSIAARFSRRFVGQIDRADTMHRSGGDWTVASAVGCTDRGARYDNRPDECPVLSRSASGCCIRL